jgi:hypothetical protein
LHYLVYSSTRPIYYYPGQSNRISGNCVSFAASDDDSSVLRIDNNTLADSPGNTSKAAPYRFQETLNFVGNATLQASNIQFTFEGPTNVFGERLTLAQSINSSNTDRDSQASLLLSNLWSQQPGINLTSARIVVRSADISGNLFSYGDLLVYSGNFVINAANLEFGGIAQMNVGSSGNATLAGVQSVSTVTEGDRTRIELIADGSSSLRFSNMNQTFGESFVLNSGSYSFSGRSVELNDCSAAPLSTGAIVGMVVGLSVAFILSLCGCWLLGGFSLINRKFRQMKQKLKAKRKQKKEPIAMNDAFGKFADQSHPHNSPTNTVVNMDGRDEVLPPFHNLHNATDESLYRSNQFLAKYPPGSPQALEAARRTANIPPSMYNAPIKISMMEPRKFDDFPFIGSEPAVFMSELEPLYGVQRITFHTDQDCSIQSNVPLLPRPLGMTSSGLGQVDECYYQVKILRKPHPDTTIGIGYATCPYPPFRLPGWDPQSVGYHSDDGAVFLNDVDFGSACGPALHEGDTLGVGYRVQSLPSGYHITFYFIHNGNKLPIEFPASDFHPSMLYPTVGADGEAEIELIFGNVQEMFFPC